MCSVNLIFQYPFISGEYSIFRFQNVNIPWFYAIFNIQISEFQRPTRDSQI